MRKLRFVSLLLALCMALTLLPASALASVRDFSLLMPKLRAYPGFSDVEGTWCEEYVKLCYETGLLNGKSAGRFDPNGTLTNAQGLVIASRLNNLLWSKTLPEAAEGDPWWLPALEHYLADPLSFDAEFYENVSLSEAAAGFAESADEDADRASFAASIFWASPELPAINRVKEVPDLAYDYGGYELQKTVLNLYEAGVVTGKNQWGTFDPGGPLTRGQAAAILARVIDPSLRVTFELTDVSEFDLFQDIFQLPPETVLMTVDDTPITLEQFAARLASACVLYHEFPYGNRTPENLPAALLEAARQDLAIERLAAEKGLQVPERVLYSFDFIPGEDAVSAYWREDHSDLLFMLVEHYAPDSEEYVDIHRLPPELDEDLSAAMEDLTATPAPVLEAMDFAALYQLLALSPYCYESYKVNFGLI